MSLVENTTLMSKHTIMNNVTYFNATGNPNSEILSCPMSKGLWRNWFHITLHFTKSFVIIHCPDLSWYFSLHNFDKSFFDTLRCISSKLLFCWLFMQEKLFTVIESIKIKKVFSYYILYFISTFICHGIFWEM